MSDREMIQQLVAVYAKALDEKDYDAIAACFRADAVVEYSGFSAVLTGRAEITAHIRKALEPLLDTQHLFTNFIIENDARSGRLSCDILAQHLRSAGATPETYMSGGRYKVEVRKTEGRWEFARLSARSVWGLGNREMLPRTD